MVVFQRSDNVCEAQDGSKNGSLVVSGMSINVSVVLQLGNLLFFVLLPIEIPFIQGFLNQSKLPTLTTIG